MEEKLAHIRYQSEISLLNVVTYISNDIKIGCFVNWGSFTQFFYQQSKNGIYIQTGNQFSISPKHTKLNFQFVRLFDFVLFLLFCVLFRDLMRKVVRKNLAKAQRSKSLLNVPQTEINRHGQARKMSISLRRRFLSTRILQIPYRR